MSDIVHELADYSDLLADIGTQLRDEVAWCTTLSRTLDPADGARAHLAVMHEPYLRYVLDGRKTVESRFSRNRVAPYGQVRRGDLLLFKVLSGPVCAIALVADVDCYVLDPRELDSLRRRFASALAADDEAFWAARSSARYATLMRLRDTRAITPIAVGKQDRRGWVVLDARGPTVHPDQMALFGSGSPSAAAPRWVASDHFEGLYAAGPGPVQLTLE